MTDQDWLKTKVYSFNDLIRILLECKTKSDLIKLSDYIMSYKKKYSIIELNKLKSRIILKTKM